MERAWSVEDLVGGLWRISRTESDQQLQDYLRRGPYPGQQNQTPEQFQQAQAAAQAAAIAAGPHAQAAYAQAQAQAQAAQGMQQAMQAMAAGKAGELVHDRGQNMQRVASLDMLRALVMQNPGQMQLSPGQAQGGMNAPPGPPGVGARGGHPSPGGHPKGMPSRPGHLQPNAVGVGVGSNPMQLNGSGSAAGQKGRNGGQQPILDKNMDKTEVRRVRRMLSNRESARRSRRRKQEHLSTLEDRLKISEQNRIVMEEKIKILISDNKRLLEENKALQETLKQQTTSDNNSNGSPVVVAPTKEQGDSPNTNGSPNGFHPRANGSPSKNESQSQGGSPGAKVKREGGEEPAPNSKRVRTEDKEEEANLKRTSSMQEFSNRLKGENEAGACTLQTAHRESWQDLSAAEQHQSVH